MIDENWAVSLERAQEFFLSQPDVTQQNGNFYYKSCCISLKAQKPSAPPCAFYRREVDKILLNQEANS